VVLEIECVLTESDAEVLPDQVVDAIASYLNCFLEGAGGKLVLVEVVRVDEALQFEVFGQIVDLSEGFAFLAWCELI